MKTGVVKLLYEKQNVPTARNNSLIKIKKTHENTNKQHTSLCCDVTVLFKVRVKVGAF